MLGIRAVMNILRKFLRAQLVYPYFNTTIAFFLLNNFWAVEMIWFLTIFVKTALYIFTQLRHQKKDNSKAV